MVALRDDCLIFQVGTDTNFPCSAEHVVIELVGETHIDPQVLREASAAVVSYYRDEIKKEFVSVTEFCETLVRVLRKLGYDVGLPASHRSDANPFPHLGLWFWMMCELENHTK